MAGNVVTQPIGTEAALTTLAASNGLNVGQIYLLSGQNRLAVATSVSSFTKLPKLTDVSDSELTVKAYVDNLINTLNAFELDGGTPSSNFTLGPGLDCGGVT